MLKYVLAAVAGLLVVGSLTGCVRYEPQTSAPEAAPVGSTPETGAVDPISMLKPDPAFRDVRPAPYTWARENRLIAHGMGGIESDKRVTNCLEAFQHNYERGFRVFEVDLVSTSDGELVARHDWEAYLYDFLGQPTDNPYRIMTLSEFESTPIHGKYTPLTIDDIMVILKAYPDVYIMTDTKSGDARDIAVAMGQIVEAMGQDTMLADRIIVQIYNEAGLWAVRGAFDCKNIVYTVYQLKPEEIPPAIEYCAANDIGVITYPDSWATPEFNASVTDRGVLGAVYTVNESLRAQELWDTGVQLVYTDFLEPGR